VEEVEQNRHGEEAPAHLLERQLKIQRMAASIIHGLGEHAFHERLERIAAGVERIATSVREQQSQPLPADPLVHIDLAQLVEDALDIAGDIGPATGIAVDIQVDAGLSKVFLPRNRLLQTLLLALGNARDAIQARQPSKPGTGRIGIRIQDLAGSRIRLSVEDDGIGLGTEQRRSLFDPGQAPRPGGGLSLHGAALFAQSLGGRLSLESEGEAKGSRFILELPSLPEASMPAGTPLPREDEWSPSP
jgi:signal transduction histidine kinase